MVDVDQVQIDLVAAIEAALRLADACGAHHAGALLSQSLDVVMRSCSIGDSTPIDVASP